MTALLTIRRPVDFRRVLSGGIRRAGGLVVAYVQISGAPTRVGFVSGRNVGGAVARNRARRLLREAWRSLLPRARAGFDVVLVARREVRGARLADVAQDLAGLLEAGGVVGR